MVSIWRRQASPHRHQRLPAAGSDLALRIYEHGPELLKACGLDPSQAGQWRLYAEEVGAAPGEAYNLAWMLLLALEVREPDGIAWQVVSLNADACMLILVPPADQFLTETRYHAESSDDTQLLLSLRCCPKCSLAVGD